MNRQQVLLSAGELSRKLGIVPARVKQLAKEGRIPVVQISPGIRKFYLTDVLAALRKEGN